MNRFLLNGASLNGSTVGGFVLAVASIACSSSAVASAVCVSSIAAEVTTTCSVLAEGKHFTGASSNFIGQAGLFPVPTHKQAATADVNAQVHILSYVLRNVEASITFNAGVGIIAVVASQQASSAALSSVTLVSQATRIQTAYANSTSSAVVNISGNPVITCFAQSYLSAQGSVRTEPHVNNEVDSYVEVVGACSIALLPVCDRTGQAYMVGQVQVVDTCNLVQPAFGYLDAFAEVYLEEARAISSLGVLLDATANVYALGCVDKQASVTLLTQVSLVPLVVQVHAAVSETTSSTELLCVSVLTTNASSNLLGFVEILSLPFRTTNAFCTVQGNTDIYCNPIVNGVASILFMGTTSLESEPDELNTRRVQGESVFACTPEILVFPEINHAAETLLEASADFVLIPEELNVNRLLAFAKVPCSAEAAFDALRTSYSSVNVLGLANITGVTSPTVRNAFVPLETRAIISSIGDVWFLVKANIAGQSSLVGSLSVAFSTPVRFTGHVSINAVGLTNADVYDPEERTFTRFAQETVFTRQFNKTDFLR